MATRRYFVFVAIRCWELMYIFRNAPMYVGFLDLGCIIHCLICSFLASTPFSGLLVLINAKKKWDWNSSCIVTVAKSTLEFYLQHNHTPQSLKVIWRQKLAISFGPFLKIIQCDSPYWTQRVHFQSFLLWLKLLSPHSSSTDFYQTIHYFYANKSISGKLSVAASHCKMLQTIL